MSAASPPEGYASGLYTDLRGRLVFYAAFEHAGDVVIAVLATEGVLRTSGDLLHLGGTTLSELGSIGTLAAKLVVDTDMRPSGRGKTQASTAAAAALGFVDQAGGPRLPSEMRCSRWIEFGRRAGEGLFAAWSMRVPSILPDLEPHSPALQAAERILARWPLAARALASCGSALPSALVEAADDELAEALVDQLFGSSSAPAWTSAAAVAFVRSVEGVRADVDLADMIGLAGCLPVDLHPHGQPDLEGFDGAAALHAEMKRHRILPNDVACLFAPFAADWTRSPLRAPFPHGNGSEKTAEDACELLLAHVAAMARRFGVPAWLEMTSSDFRDLPARTADNLVLAVIMALAEESSNGMAPMAEVFLRDLDLKRLLWSLGIEQTRAQPRIAGGHMADVEGNFRDAEAAGEFAGRMAQRLRTGGARRIGIELVEAGFGADLDIARIRREVGTDVARTRRFSGMPSPPIVHVPPTRPASPPMGPVRMAAGVACGAVLALIVAGFGLSAAAPPQPSAPRSVAAGDQRSTMRQTSDWTSLSRLVDRREDLGNAVRGNPVPCPAGVADGIVCGRFGDLTFVLRNWSTPKPAIAAYVVEGRHPVEVFSWSSTSIRQPTGVWTRHLLQALDASVARPPVEREAKALADVRAGDDP